MSDSQKFIVIFKASVTKEQIDKYIEEVRTGGGEVSDDECWHYSGIVNGFAAKLEPGQLQNFRASDVIEYLEPDGPVTILPVTRP